MYETGIFSVETGMKKSQDSDPGADRSLPEYNLRYLSAPMETTSKETNTLQTWVKLKRRRDRIT